MITDQKQTGVPSATRGRTQLIKPLQLNNSGKVSPAYNPFLPKNVQQTAQNYETAQASQPIKQQGNPFQAPSNSNFYTGNRTIPQGITTDEYGNNATYGHDTGITDPSTGENLFTTRRFGDPVNATPSMQDKVAELGRLFEGATEEEQYNFLQRVAQGIYKANGMQTSATMTGDGYIANSNQDRYK